MKTRVLTAACASALLAACGPEQSSDNQASNDLIRSAETRVGGSEPDATAAVAVDADTARRLMDERHENYERIGDAMKLVTRELKASSPDLAKVREGATVIATLAPQIPSWFPAGTGPDVGKTEARAEIWQRPDDFRAKAAAMNEAAQTFRTAAAGTDLAAIRAAHAELGKTCKACHDLYRAEH